MTPPPNAGAVLREARKLRPKPTVYQRIMRAAKAGKGLRISVDEVWGLSHDGAIMARSDLDNHGIDSDTDALADASEVQK